MARALPEKLFGLTLLPLDYYEDILCLLPEIANANQRHKIIGGKVLCEHPDNWDYGSNLESGVTCLKCRAIWSFRVSAEGFRTENRSKEKYKKTVLTRLMDRNSCGCESCRIIQGAFLRGESSYTAS